MITKRGRELAAHIKKFVGDAPAVLDTCSRIARLAATHNKLQELNCNRGLTPSEDKQDDLVEKQISMLVALLPPMADSQRIAVEFSGDPRGFTVKLVVPGDKSGNTWGLDGKYGI